MADAEEFIRLQRVAGKRSIVASVVNIPVVALIAWFVSDPAQAPIDDPVGRWSVVAFCLVLIAMECWLAYWVFGELVMHTKREQEANKK